MRDVHCFGVVGTGVIGAGWAARALSRGLDVVAWDPATGAEDRLRAQIDNAWPALSKLGLSPGADRQRLAFTRDLESLCARADFIQENAPENEDLKRDLHARVLREQSLRRDELLELREELLRRREEFHERYRERDREESSREEPPS